MGELDPGFIPVYTALYSLKGLRRSDVEVHGYLIRWRAATRRCFSSHKRISEELSVSRGAVRQALQRLKAAGAITCCGRTRDDGSQASNEYWALYPHEIAGLASQLSSLPSDTGEQEGTTGVVRPPATGVVPNERDYVVPRQDISVSDGEELLDCTPPYRSIASWIANEFVQASPGQQYKLTKVDRTLLKKIWDELKSKPEVAKVFASAALKASQDQFWKDRWSVKWVYSQLSHLLNLPVGGDDERELGEGRVLVAAWGSLVRTCTQYGIAEGDAERVLSGIVPEGGDQPARLQKIRKLTATLTREEWRQAILASPDPLAALETAARSANRDSTAEELF